MSLNAKKLSSIADRKQKLLDEEIELIEKRTNEIGAIAKRFELLTLSDEIITGLFLQAVKAKEENSDQLREWEDAGTQFLKPKKITNIQAA